MFRPDIILSAATALPRRQRADARVSLTVALQGGATRVQSMGETGSARIRLPTSRVAALEAVVINTGGGVAAGDRFATAITVGAGADLLVTSSAAEKVYKSDDGANAQVTTTLDVAAGGRLAWLPQETILFDRARLRRRLDVALAPDASVILFEAAVFGRAAFGETMTSGALEDRWRVSRGGRLVYADTLRIAGAMADKLARPTIGGGRRALATLLYVAPDAEARIEAAREWLAGAESECGASAWNGLLAVRFLAASAEALRRDAARFITGFRGCAMPRVWQS